MPLSITVNSQKLQIEDTIGEDTIGLASLFKLNAISEYKEIVRELFSNQKISELITSSLDGEPLTKEEEKLIRELFYLKFIGYGIYVFEEVIKNAFYAKYMRLLPTLYFRITVNGEKLYFSLNTERPYFSCGRNTDNDLLLPDVKLFSRLHFIFTYGYQFTDMFWTIQDYGSLNGVYTPNPYSGTNQYEKISLTEPIKFQIGRKVLLLISCSDNFIKVETSKNPFV
jgi:hypothetical protein